MISKRSWPWSRCALAGELQRRLVGLGAGVAEEDRLGERGGAEPLGQPDLGLGREEVRGVPEQRGLGLEGGAELGIRVAEAGGRDAAHQVEIAAALGVDQPATLAAHEADRLRGVVGDEDFLAPVGDLGVGRHGSGLSRRERAAQS